MDRKLTKLRDNFLGDVSSRQYLKTPYLVFAVAILLTIGVTYFFYQSIETRDRARFNADVFKLNSTLEYRLNSYISLLKAGRGFMEASSLAGKEVTRESFARFVRGLELEQAFEGVQGIGYLKRTRLEDQEALTKRMAAEGYNNFAVFPQQGLAPENNIVLYLEPLHKDANASAIGYAMSIEDAKRAAMEKACLKGEAAISERIYLVQEPTKPNSVRRPGFLMFVPIYASDIVPKTDEEKKRLLEGYIYSPFRAENFLADVKKMSSVTDISFAIYDQEIGPENLLARSDPEVIEESGNSSITQSLSRMAIMPFETNTVTNLGNEKWVVHYKSLPSFHSNSSTGWTLVIFFFGLGISLLLFFITLSQSKAHTSLEVIAKDLARSEKVKDEFIAVVSHELRTPLNSIAGGVTILRNGNTNEQTRSKALDIIEKNLRSQVSLVEDMIVFSDINAGKEYLQLKTLNLSAFVDRLFEEFMPLTQAKNISFKKQDNLNGQTVAADEAKLEKALRNILSNAVKFTPPGGEIAIDLKPQQDMVQLVIRDNGFGIHPQILPYVFDLFKQGDSSTVRRHGGLGLGLALSRHIVQLHGGSLDAGSDGIDKGSVFTIKLPQTRIE